MRRLQVKPVCCCFESQTYHLHPLYSKHPRTNQTLALHRSKRFELVSPRGISEGKEYLVLKRTNGEVVYELFTLKGDGERSQVCQEDIPVGDHSTRRIENKLRWQFLSRVYAILAAQISFCAVVSTAICLCVPVKQLLSRIHPFIAFAVALMPFILSWPLAIYRKQHPVNITLLGILTTCVSIDIAICCAAIKGKLVLQALLLTMAGVTSLTGYTYWASEKGRRFSYFRPFLSSSLAILLVTGILQLFFPLVSKGNAIYAVLVAIVFSGYLVHDLDSMLKHYKYNEYIAASVSIFLDIVIFFLSNLDLLQYCGDLFS